MGKGRQPQRTASGICRHNDVRWSERCMGIGLQLREIARSDIDAAKEGVHPMYVFVLAAYVGPETPKDHLWVTELCARIKKPFDGNLEACQTHNGYYYSDSNLTGVP